MIKAVLVFLIIAKVFISGEEYDDIQCKNEDNQPVDWYVLYKIPKISHSTNPLIKEGHAYLYMTSESVNKGWQLSANNISTKDSIPGYTLAPLYKGMDNSILWMLYSDQPPNRTPSAKYGHAKGAIIVSKEKGFWLVHSVPHFPPASKTSENQTQSKNVQLNSHNIPDSQYGYPASGRNYGQSFLCISVEKDQINNIGQQLIYNQVVIYDKNFPLPYKQSYPSLNELVNRVWIKDPPYNHKSLIQSLGAFGFLTFAKSDKWQKDLYDDFVAPALKSDMLVQSWLNGRGKLPSECNGTKVMNIQSLVLEKANVNFKSTHDHSKWAIVVNNNKNNSWTCIGDINRADTQYNRGGGAVCFNLPDAWENYRKIVQDIEPCPKKRGFISSTISWVKSKFT
ncbi:plancitoxin-1 [Orussus abietinus]|uniref:plancitoxin-1 n=1 Tax=Orussus abietinus TaxID=222816 RepID=UPI000625C76C|nr:plancitoxin-1 [Orussus abietinus]